jgi:hypothetical protein
MVKNLDSIITYLIRLFTKGKTSNKYNTTDKERKIPYDKAMYRNLPLALIIIVFLILALTL